MWTLKEEAQRHDEWATNRFMLRYMTRHIFTEPEWILGTEVPPKDTHSQLRMDISVQNYNTEARVLQFRLIGQAKKGKASPSHISRVEAQAHQLCQEYLVENKLQSVWAMTYFGTKARIWACERKSKYLAPFYPFEGELGDRDAYADIVECESHFTWAFQKVKEIAVPDPKTLRQLYVDAHAEVAQEYTAANVATSSWY
ncbi:uncharacterized protein HRG_11911 [Hirsutella rhossiliensis]|uniref:Uncharacterized protein n=1 Tax=Hirsutella rhossiliensis TaxID=111463 RepID=A0A9P8ML44_9HYPO|nr:uncharacterized protein HRG_11911 [Hirsutella rhossiliensis]KAH0957009.1 hypothetical protein HRG_11911 [Hirsutella rhossiliensis]